MLIRGFYKSRLFFVLFLIAGLATIGVGVFPEDSRPMHGIVTPIALIFAALSAISSYRLHEGPAAYFTVILGAGELQWKDIDFNTRQVRITPEKGSNPRILPISTELIAMLNLLQTDTEYVFKKGEYEHFSEGFRRHCKKIAVALGDKDLRRITLRTMRHYKGTMKYQKTKDILHVMRTLGHKNIKNTLVYTHLINFKADEYITKVAKGSNEACQLLEAGFEYVLTTPDGLMIF